MIDAVAAGADEQYLALLREVSAHGDPRIDRTGVGTKSLFGAMARFDLSDGTVPILTTKRVFWKAAVREMMWFLSGGTNIRPLLQQGVTIWTDWPLARYRRATGEDIAQDAFEARIVADEAFAAKWGELGPVYGKQWRRWAGPDGREHDQIGAVLDALRNNPTSRRILFHAWNVADLPDMALPPCHMVYQFHVTGDGRLNSLMYQRSADLFLGVPFNWVGQAAITLMLAQQASLRPGQMVWMAGDVHLYANHADAVATQLGRTPGPAPQMNLTARPALNDYRIEDFVLSGYDPHPAIAAPVAV